MDDPPYRARLVQLEEGPLLVSNFVGDSDNSPNLDRPATPKKWRRTPRKPLSQEGRDYG